MYRLTHWEVWDYRVKLIPLIPIWLWHCGRSRSWWFFTTANPTLTFGGFEGETKREMYEQLPPDLCPKSIYIAPTILADEAEQLVATHFDAYPVAVKPNVGMMGLLFRVIYTANELRLYHQQMPVEYIVQDLITYPIEVSVFYYRFPGDSTGTITGFVRKDFLEVIGDGHSTLWELLQQYPPARFRLDELRAKHANRLDYVVPNGERYRLSNALNQTRGGRLVSLAHEKDQRLLSVFDALSHFAGHFYFGRYDIKCASIDDLKAGRNFSILEFNGAGAAPHHVYGNGNSLWQAYRIVIHHWSVLARIARQNHARGVPYWSFQRGWNQLKSAQIHLQLLKKLDRAFLHNVENDLSSTVARQATRA
ncbi:ATP-grasp domain-containing protein [Telluribacter humicola]|uniref:hypothetical protein n=1 Tax=Telluribacter humicola TaxID=1720261 RepID=UPI001A96E55B|nr:hypothetical protein [Telluribacter humicola]